METTTRGGKLVALEDHTFELRSPLVVSAIGSLPEPIPGIVMKGTFYDYADWDTGAYAPVAGVFGVGNVVTGRGNIKASEHHSKDVANWLVEHYLGVHDADEDRTVAGLFEHASARGEAAATHVVAYLKDHPPLPAAQAEALVARIRARQAEIGYQDYASWMAAVTAADAE
jgi:ferredoxin--NADP+ reductase